MYRDLKLRGAIINEKNVILLENEIIINKYTDVKNLSNVHIKTASEFVFIKSYDTNLFDKYTAWTVGTSTYQTYFILTTANEITMVLPWQSDYLVDYAGYLYYTASVTII